MVVLLALTGVAALDLINRRNLAAQAAATEALEIYRAGGPRRFRNRVDTAGDLRIAAAVCCDVLAVVAAEGDEPERVAPLLGQAERLRADAGAEVPSFQSDAVDRARDLAVAALGSAAFLAGFERGSSATSSLPATEPGAQR